MYIVTCSSTHTLHNATYSSHTHAEVSGLYLHRSVTTVQLGLRCGENKAKLNHHSPSNPQMVGLIQSSIRFNRWSLTLLEVHVFFSEMVRGSIRPQASLPMCIRTSDHSRSFTVLTPSPLSLVQTDINERTNHFCLRPDGSGILPGLHFPS